MLLDALLGSERGCVDTRQGRAAPSDQSLRALCFV